MKGSKKKNKRKFSFVKFINYTSDLIMLAFVLIFFCSVIFTGIIVWKKPSELSCFVDLVKDVVMLAVGGYWGRIALTHYQTLKKGKKVVSDFVTSDDLEEKGDTDYDDE